MVVCAACGQQLRVPAGAARIRCPKCQHQQTVSGSARVQGDAGRLRPAASQGEAPMKLLSGLFGIVAAVCGFGVSLLWLYVQWLYMRQSFFNMLNPLLQLDILLTMISMPLFWGLAITGVVCYFAMVGAEQRAD